MMAQERQDNEGTVDQYLFRSYKKPSPPSPPTPPREEEEQHSWNKAGAFPSGGSVDHVFTDESYTDESSYEQQRGYSNHHGYRLDVVKEESSKASTEAQVSKSSASRPHAHDRIEVDHQRTPMPQHQVDSKTNGTSSSGVSDLTFPYTLYNNLAKARDDRNYSPDRQRHAGPPNARRPKHPGTPDMEVASSPSFGRKQQVRPIPVMESVKDDTSIFGSVTSSKLRKMNKRGTHKSYAIAHSSNNPATMLKNFFVVLEQHRLMHKLTAQHMRVVDTWFLFAPSITLTLMTGVVIFVFETTLKVQNDGRVYAAIIAGITAFVSVFWQALSRQLDLGTQGALHEMAAGTLQKLSADILFTISSTPSDDGISAHYVALVAEKYDQAMAMSPATIPYVLESAFASVSHSLELMLNPPTGKKSKRKKRLQNVELIRLYATAYDELAAEVLHHWAWPLAFPQPRRASERAIRRFTLVITEGRRSNRRGLLSYLRPLWKGENKPKKSLFDVFPTSSSVSGGDQDSVSVYHTPQRKPLIQTQSPYQDEHEV